MKQNLIQLRLSTDATGSPGYRLQTENISALDLFICYKNRTFHFLWLSHFPQFKLIIIDFFYRCFTFIFIKDHQPLSGM